MSNCKKLATLKKQTQHLIARKHTMPLDEYQQKLKELNLQLKNHVAASTSKCGNCLKTKRLFFSMN